MNWSANEKLLREDKSKFILSSVLRISAINRIHVMRKGHKKRFNPLTPRAHVLKEGFKLDMSQISSNLLKKAFAT